MFENMMKYEKAIGKFIDWIEGEYDLEMCIYSKKLKFIGFNFIDDCGITESFYIKDDFILSIMPFFFDEYGIEIIYGTLIDKNKKNLYNLMGSDRLKSLINCCEKAFEILNNQLEAQNV